MWDRLDIPKISLALPICMALTASIALSGVRRMTCTSRWALIRISQLIAASMRLNLDLPLFSREELHRNPLLNERVVQWEIGGARGDFLHWNGSSQEEKLAVMDIAGPSSCDNAPAAPTSPSCENAPTSVAQAEDVEHPVTEESEPRSSKRIPPLQVPKWIFDATTEEDEIWRIIPEDQMQNPQIRCRPPSHSLLARLKLLRPPRPPNRRCTSARYSLSCGSPLTSLPPLLWTTCLLSILPTTQSTTRAPSTSTGAIFLYASASNHSRSLSPLSRAREIRPIFH
eukprot:6214521-Pleurochrysis_carterae.AAC.1